MTPDFASPDPTVSTLRRSRSRIRSIVTSALNDGRIGLAWQPVLRCDSKGMIAFHEGLMRLRLPSGEVLRASSFIDEVENTPLGSELDREALRITLQLLSADPRVRLSVNISASTMLDMEWNAILADAAAREPELPERLIVELTERGAMRDPDSTIDFLARNRKLGCAFAIDDFGAGQTAFAYFRRFRFDMVKIDGEFIRDLHRNPDHAVLVEVLVRLAQHFDMLTVAEFIENADEARAAAALGVDCLQGYYCGHAGDAPILLDTALRRAVS